MAQGTSNGTGTVEQAAPTAVFTPEQMAALKGMLGEVIGAIAGGDAPKQPTRTVVAGLPQIVDAIATAATAGNVWLQQRDGKVKPLFSSGSRGFQLGSNKVIIGGLPYSMTLVLTEQGSKPNAD